MKRREFVSGCATLGSLALVNPLDLLPKEHEHKNVQILYLPKSRISQDNVLCAKCIKFSKKEMGTYGLNPEREMLLPILNFDGKSINEVMVEWFSFPDPNNERKNFHNLLVICDCKCPKYGIISYKPHGGEKNYQFFLNYKLKDKSYA